MVVSPAVSLSVFSLTSLFSLPYFDARSIRYFVFLGRNPALSPYRLVDARIIGKEGWEHKGKRCPKDNTR